MRARLCGFDLRALALRIFCPKAATGRRITSPPRPHLRSAPFCFGGSPGFDAVLTQFRRSLHQGQGKSQEPVVAVLLHSAPYARSAELVAIGEKAPTTAPGEISEV